MSEIAELRKAFRLGMFGRSLKGHSFAIVGMTSLSYESFANLINLCEGWVHTTVVMPTDYLVYGVLSPSDRHKVLRARMMGVTVITEEGFVHLARKP